MKGFVVCGALLALCTAITVSTDDPDFEDWKDKFRKSYSSSEEEVYRKDIWLSNRDYVVKHNELADLGFKSFRLGMTYFADMKNEEYKQMAFGNCLTEFKSKQNRRSTFQTLPMKTLVPSSIDWRNEGYVTPVKDQRECGSCWAFSATGSLEGQHFRYTGELLSLSEQQLVDCSSDFGNDGCDGGLMDYAYEYIAANKGINTEESYPYEARNGRCHFNASAVTASCSGFADIFAINEKALQATVATIGPVSVAIDASHISFQLYESGIYDEPECSSNDLDHGVLAVGYGTRQDLDYWLVKNSWGHLWGMDGYIYMSRNKGNQCGIATLASYPIV
ncbi:procathepsin L-like isoform X1 [Protopterus annectens]|uniref:procathepsin L-like isoform X1 n=1 Tax=Protopterus annectens TaxID=7888 RepID=UPI001CFB9302|nr:procathepsin L-like isoform X1 [Protopterus annectens]